MRKYFYISLSIFFLCTPFSAMTIGEIGSALKILAILPIFFGLFSIIISKNKLVYIYCGYAIITFLSCLWSFNQSHSLVRAYTYIEFAILIYISGCVRNNDKDKKMLYKALIWSSRFTAVLLLLIGDYYEDRLTFMGAIDEDPNYLCMYFSFGIVGSRGGLIAIIASVCVYFMLEIRKTAKKRLFLIFILLSFVSVFAVTHLSNIVSFSERYTLDDVVSSGGTGRIDIWNFGWRIFLEFDIFNMLFGSGIASSDYWFSIHGFGFSVMHNIFLETLIEIGILGFLFYVYMLLSFLIEVFKIKNYYSFSIMLGFLVLSLSTSLSTFKPYLNIMIYIVIITSSHENNEECSVSSLSETE